MQVKVYMGVLDPTLGSTTDNTAKNTSNSSSASPSSGECCQVPVGRPLAATGLPALGVEAQLPSGASYTKDTSLGGNQELSSSEDPMDLANQAASTQLQRVDMGPCKAKRSPQAHLSSPAPAFSDHCGDGVDCGSDTSDDLSEAEQELQLLKTAQGRSQHSSPGVASHEVAANGNELPPGVATATQPEIEAAGLETSANDSWTPSLRELPCETPKDPVQEAFTAAQAQVRGQQQSKRPMKVLHIFGPIFRSNCS